MEIDLSCCRGHSRGSIRGLNRGPELCYFRSKHLDRQMVCDCLASLAVRGWTRDLLLAPTRIFALSRL